MSAPPPRAIAVRVHRIGIAPTTRAFKLGLDQPKVNAPTVQIDATYLYVHDRPQAVTYARALTAKLLAHFIETEKVTAQLCDVHQALDIHRIQGHKQAKARNT